MKSTTFKKQKEKTGDSYVILNVQTYIIEFNNFNITYLS